MHEQSDCSKKYRQLAGLMMAMILAAPPVTASDDQMVKLTGLVAATILAAAQGPANAGEPKPAPATGKVAATARKASPYRPANIPDSAGAYFQSVWGVDNLLVRQTASGNLIRFSYRVTDPARAKALGDKKATPYLIGQTNRAVLQIPVMNKIGQLRQTGAGEAGKEYWMVFSNKGNVVKPGDRVNVVVGDFHVEGLVVE